MVDVMQSSRLHGFAYLTIGSCIVLSPSTFPIDNLHRMQTDERDLEGVCWKEFWLFGTETVLVTTELMAMPDMGKNDMRGIDRNRRPNELHTTDVWVIYG